MGTLLAFPVLIATLMVQMVIVNRLPLLNGTADLMLLTLVSWALQERVKNVWIWALVGGALVTFASAMPAYLPLISYLLVTAIARILQHRVWQSPILALLVAVVAGTLLNNFLSLFMFQLLDRPIPLKEGLSLVAIPGLLLNLLLALPVYTVLTDLANWLYPPMEE
ncbi:MAG TPA: hypothetical protein VHO48_09920 [Anaerolineaceae bacterium]|nr:hypothetical protein [Anaerolineaceae bacterium]